jgi:hypothetical protein
MKISEIIRKLFALFTSKSVFEYRQLFNKFVVRTLTKS